MNFLRTKTIVLLGALTLCTAASANDDFWVGVKAGTLGYGAEAAWKPLEWLDVRAGANFYDYNDAGAQAGINYDGTLALDTIYVTGNFRFLLSPFRLTAGAFMNSNEVRLVSQPMPSYDLGSTQGYLPAEVGSLQSVASFSDVSPYLGAGYDFSVMDRLGLSLDFGVLWQGEPTVSMTSDGALALINDPGFLADLEAERLELEDELKNMKAYPVISIGFSFNF
jgi:hypothetical protein